MAVVQTPYQLMYQTIFFENQQSVEKEALLQKLKPYFYRGVQEVSKNINIQSTFNKTDVLRNEVSFPPVEINQERTKKPIKNSLFWCLYHANHGPLLHSEKYDINMELQERHKIADHFREKTGCLKDRRHRLTNADVDEIVSNLLTLSARKTFWATCFGDIPTDISQAVVFAQYYKKNIDIYVPDRRIMVSFIYEEQADKISLFYEPTSNLFEITENAKTTGYLSMETMKTSLKPLSKYKLGELIEMGQQLGISSLPKKKGELYQRIIEHCHGLIVSS